MDTLGEGAESRNVGGIAKKTTERLVVGSTNKKSAGDTGGEKVRENAGGGGRTRKVETTCRNNVRVFDLRHVTEPH